MANSWIERTWRSFGKVITWRILVTITNFIVGWLASGNPWVGLGVVSFALVVNSILYFVHERIWNRVTWGKAVVDDQPTQADAAVG